MEEFAALRGPSAHCEKPSQTWRKNCIGRLDYSAGRAGVAASQDLPARSPHTGCTCYNDSTTHSQIVPVHEIQHKRFR